MKTCYLIRDALQRNAVTQDELSLILMLSPLEISKLLNGKSKALSKEEEQAISTYIEGYALVRKYDSALNRRLFFARYAKKGRG